MIGWDDVYKVIVAMVPLYFALVLGYGSVRWWKIFTREECDAINKLVCYFTLPLFAFDFTAHIDPFKMNFLFIGADTLSKLIIVAVIGLWAKCSGKGSSSWSITSFSLCTLTNSLVVGMPMVKPMYGALGVDLVVQGSVVQAIVWLTLLLFVLEYRRTGLEGTISSTSLKPKASSISSVMMGEDEERKDLEGNRIGMDVILQDGSSKLPFFELMKRVWLKFIVNPNSYACVIGISWAFISNRWNLELPSMVDGSILIMSRAGTGTAMFSMGIFMALQEKVISCGPSLTIFGLVLKFIAGPAAMAISAIVVGLRGDVLRIAIIQAAIPQSITSFIFAKEYGLHADVLSTAVIFGMIVSLPILVAFYAILEFIH
ncbi:unnamed protein product [Lathyrus sativus]|nr:unnamed protein product [Lathyrus sativus]